METPSQRKRRKKGQKKRKQFKTQLEVDIDNGFDASRFLRPTNANYRTVKQAMDKQRKKLIKEAEKIKKQEADAEAYEAYIKKQERINRKNKTIFDVIDIDD